MLEAVAVARAARGSCPSLASAPSEGFALPSGPAPWRSVPVRRAMAACWPPLGLSLVRVP